MNNSLVNTLEIITEQQIDDIFSGSIGNEAIWFRASDGRYFAGTNGFLHYLTKKSFLSPNDIYKLNEYELYHKNDWHYIKCWNKNDAFAYSKKIWVGIEPCVYQGQRMYALARKIPVIDRYNNVIGNIGNVLYHIDSNYIETIAQSLTDCETFTAQTHCNTFTLDTNNFTVKLTHRESECLFYMLRGKSAKGTAQILGLSSKTIEFYLQTLKSKFDCLSKSQLIEKAIALGYLNLLPVSLMK